MNKHTLILLFIISTFCIGCYKNPVERNTIVFNDSVQNVQDSLINMQKLLSIMPRSQTVFNTNYYYVEEDLFINNSKVGNPDSILLDTVQGFNNFSEQQKKQFIHTSKYLLQNYITAGYFDTKENLWFFEYRTIEIGDYHETREIVILKNTDTLLLQNTSKILDKQGLVYLLAPKDAKIR